MRPFIVATVVVLLVVVGTVLFRHGGPSAIHGHRSGESAGHGAADGVSLAGEYAFATIAEIVSHLDSDPSTDWSSVNIPALRDHLVDMHHVTMLAKASTDVTQTGVNFRVTGDTEATIASIRRMTSAHAMTMGSTSEAPIEYQVKTIEGGAEVSLLTSDEATLERLAALGFHGFLALGNHHPQHHLALASGRDPHAH